MGKKLFKLIKLFLFLAAMLALSGPGQVWAQFGTNGIVVTPIGSNNSDAYSLIQQPDGKLVAIGVSNNGAQNCFTLVRYNSNGSLDTSFGGNGIVVTSIGSGNDYAASVVLQPDGKLVVAGNSSNGGAFALARYNSNGSLDTSFGAGGIVETTVGTGANGASSLILQPDGKLVAGGSTNGIYYCQWALVRYNSNGSLDVSFGNGGKVITDAGSGYCTYAINSMIIQPDGKLVAAGQANLNGSGQYYFALVRYNSNGGLDTSFGSNGKAYIYGGGTYSQAMSLILQPDGKLVAAGNNYNGYSSNFVLARFNGDGSIDNNFGSGGLIRTAIGSGGATAYSLILQPNGNLVAAGVSTYNGLAVFTLACYSSNGSLNTGFGSNGMVETLVGSGNSYAYNLMLQSDGKLVAAGYSNNGTINCFTLVRYNSDGTLDITKDSTPPVSTLTIGDPKHPLPDGTTLVAVYTPFILSAVDLPGPGESTASGVDKIQYAVKTTAIEPAAAEWQAYSQPITLANQDGIRYFWYRSLDLAGNVEKARFAGVQVKASLPTAELAVPSPANIGICRVINGQIKVYGTAGDPYFAGYTLSLVSAGNTLIIATGNSPVGNSVLADVNCDNYADGVYYLTLVVEDVLGQTSTAAAAIGLHLPALTQIIRDYGGTANPDHCPQPIAPQYFAKDSLGNIYVTDNIRKRAYELDPIGTKLLAVYPAATSFTQPKGELNNPQGIAVDGEGYVYIVDQGCHSIVKYTPTGEYVQHWPLSGHEHGGCLDGPQGMTLGPDGLLYVADKNNGRVAVFDRTGNFVKEIAITGQVTAACHGEAKALPTDVGIYQGFLYVTDENGSVYKFRLSDAACIAVIKVSHATCNEPGSLQGIAINALGYWYVTDKSGHQVVKFTPRDERIAQWQVTEVVDKRNVLGEPQGVMSLDNGEVLVADTDCDDVERAKGACGGNQSEGDIKRYGLDDQWVWPHDAPKPATTSSAAGDATPTPLATPLAQNSPLPQCGGEVRPYPNPAKNQVNFVYQQSGATKMSISIYKISGELVAHIDSLADAGGSFKAAWQAAGVAPGIYLCRIKITDPDGKILSDQKRKVALIR